MQRFNFYMMIHSLVCCMQSARMLMMKASSGHSRQQEQD
jgi:hypothetical protein